MMWHGIFELGACMHAGAGAGVGPGPYHECCMNIVSLSCIHIYNDICIYINYAKYEFFFVYAMKKVVMPHYYNMK